MLLAISLVIGWVSSAPAAPIAASAHDNSTAAITVFAPGASLGAPVSVQYIDGVGHWRTVKGWSGGTFELVDAAHTPYKQYTVLPANYGQGPFRWVVYNQDGTVWGMSDTFNLPPGGGIELQETIVPDVTGVPTLPPGVTPTPKPVISTAAPVTPLPTAKIDPGLLLKDTGQTYMSMGNRSDDNSSAITGYFLGLPADAWIVVQWGDGLGHYQTVTGWQGTADMTAANTGQLVKQFMVMRPNFGQGPFRWAVYDQQGGTLLGLSTDFMLPKSNGVNYFMSYSK